ncbi:MAG: exonuclease SbcCD subunit D [Nocardiaceae bacterium]|nr:exonuclease SbcCD subunit D [Nocardiaceae bacterium]
MRILHTSDWHIGRTFHGVDLLADQRAALLAIADLVTETGADVVVLAGDVYDRAIPSADAVSTCMAGLEAIRAAGAQLVVSSGNHDSAPRLGAGSSFAAAGGLHLRTELKQIAQPVELVDEHGPVLIYGIPYLEPEVTRHGLECGNSHESVLTAAMSRIRADVESRESARTVVVAHAFVVGGEPSESERSISVGGVETVPAGVFAGVDYVALGHLHSPQTIAENIRYSGSVLPYSFAETSHRKAVWVVDLDAQGLSNVERRDLPIIRGLSTLTASLEQLLTDPVFSAYEGHYISALLTDAVRPPEAMRKLKGRFPFAVHLDLVNQQAVQALDYRRRVKGRTDLDVARGFVTDVRGEPTDGEVAWLERALAQDDRQVEPTGVAKSA